MELFFRSFVLVVLLTLSGAACAVGMGGINVSSALGEPLNAEIELAGIGYKANMGGSLTARIASPDVFKGAGLDYPHTLPSLKFIIDSRPDGKPYLRITSQSPVNDPFVTLLVELNWPSGRLLREYTFLLDPPGFKPEQPTEARVKPLAPIAVSSPKYPSVEAVNIESARASARTPVVSTSPIADMPESSGRTSSGKIVVKRGDTLRKIAQYAGSPDISLERMLVALYRANANEFDGHNMNRIRVGKILRLPSKEVIEKVSQANALEEIHVQAADWDAYRQKLAAASVTAKEPPSGQEVSGKISAKVADNAPAPKESAKEVVRLSKGEAPGDKAVSGGASKALNDKLAGLQEELIAKDIRLKDNSSRIELLEKNIREMQHLVELKSQTMASAKLAESKPVSTPESSAETKSDASAKGATGSPAVPGGEPVAQQAKTAPQPDAVPQEVSPSPSMVDELIGGNPIYLAGFAVVLLALGGGVIAVRRRKRGNQGWGKLEKSILEPVVPAPASADSTQSTTIISALAPEEEIDPVKEAELFLNFGRDAQAEEILKDALEKDRNNRHILLKLLSIYLERKDAKAFHAIAQQVRDLGDDGTWAQAAAMGRKLEPDNPVYAIGEPEAEKADENLIPEPVRKEQTSHGLDFDLDFGGEKFGTSASAVFVLDKPSESSALDFDLGDAMAGIGGEAKAGGTVDKTAQFTIDENPAVQSDTQHGSIGVTSRSMSLPVGGVGIGKNISGAEAAPAADEVIDISSISMSLSLPVGKVEAPRDVTGSEAAPDVDEVIDITSKSMSLSLPVWGVEIGKTDTGGVETPAEDEVIDITSMSMSMSLPTGGTEIGSHDKGGEAIPADDDVIDITAKSMSLPQGGRGMVAPVQSESSLFQGIDLNLNEPVTRDLASEVKDEHWAEVATKIDLAKAYQEMGDAEGAHEILKEVMDEGNAQQRATAKSMLELLAS